MEKKKTSAYHRSCMKILYTLLIIWFIASFGCGIIWREWLDENIIQIGHADFGFWMAQQGAIISFVLILIIYSFIMNRLDRKHGYTEKGEK